MFDIWNNNYELVDKAYRQDNYLVRDTNGGRYCVIYCSSNDIWYPNEETVFYESIIQNNRFEWTNFRCDQACREIFIRDIYKSWYVTGINERIDSIDSLVLFLRQLTNNLPVILIGSSAGGYLAALLSYKLNAKYAIVFSAQFELRNEWAKSVNQFLQRYENNSDRSQYYDLKPLLQQSETPIYYIFPYECPSDRHQYEHVRDVKCINPIGFKASHHGVVLPKTCLKWLINLSESDLSALARETREKELSPLVFSIRTVGARKTILDLARQINSIVKRRLVGKY